MPEECSEKCVLYDREAMRIHSTISADDPELITALRSFASWFYRPGQDIEEQIRYAAQLYTRDDHAGTCVPKTLLFAHYKHLQFSSEDEPLQVSDQARAAMNGTAVPCWPGGETVKGSTWKEMFGDYSSRYD